MKTAVKNLKRSLEEKLQRSLRLCAVALVGGGLLVSCSSGSNENYYEEYKAQNAANAETAAAEAPAEDDGKGIGPVKTVEVGAEIDQALAEKGKAIFEGKCSACHQLSDQKIVGPGLAGVTERRKPEWVMNMIINPEEMTKKDPTAKKLLAEHLTQMTNQNVTEDDSRAILEYLRQNDKAQ